MCNPNTHCQHTHACTSRLEAFTPVPHNCPEKIRAGSCDPRLSASQLQQDHQATCFEREGRLQRRTSQQLQPLPSAVPPPRAAADLELNALGLTHTAIPAARVTWRIDLPHALTAWAGGHLLEHTQGCAHCAHHLACTTTLRTGTG